MKLNLSRDWYENRIESESFEVGARSMQTEEKPVVIYTSAPVDYDWGWTKQLVVDHSTFGSPSDTNPKVLRKVEVSDEYHAKMQYGRYQSGLHLAMYEDEYNQEQAADYIKPHPEPKPIYRTNLVLDDEVNDSEEFLETYMNMSRNNAIAEMASKKLNPVKTNTFVDNEGNYVIQIEVFNDEALFNQIVNSLKEKAGSHYISG